MIRVPLIAVLAAAASAAGAAPVTLDLSGPNGPVRSPDDSGLTGAFPGAPFALVAETGEFIPEGELADVDRISTNVTGPDVSVQSLTITPTDGRPFDLLTLTIPGGYFSSLLTVEGSPGGSEASVQLDQITLAFQSVALTGVTAAGGTVSTTFVPAGPTSDLTDFFFENADPAFGPEAFGDGFENLTSLTFEAVVDFPGASIVGAACLPINLDRLSPEARAICPAATTTAPFGSVSVPAPPGSPFETIDALADEFVGPRNDDAFYQVASVTVAPIPLPASLPLLLAGVGALAWRARRGG